MKDIQTLPPVVTYELKEGDTWTRAWALTDDFGQPINLSGASVEFSASDEDGAQLFSYVDVNQKAWIAGNGVYVRLERDDTRQAGLDGARFEVTLTRSNGEIRTLRDGVYRVRPEVVKDE